VLIDGRPLVGYAGAYLAGGRVFAPVAPLLTGLADRIWFEGDALVIERGTRRVRIQLVPARGGQFDATYVAAAPVLRALGASVHYEAKERRLVVAVSSRAIVTSPTPFDPSAPSVAPTTVFTPAPPSTPRPVWTGSPYPRRTALPFPPPLTLRE
jgi:hypothetical protein